MEQPRSTLRSRQAGRATLTSGGQRPEKDVQMASETSSTIKHNIKRTMYSAFPDVKE